MTKRGRITRLASTVRWKGTNPITRSRGQVGSSGGSPFTPSIVAGSQSTSARSQAGHEDAGASRATAPPEFTKAVNSARGPAGRVKRKRAPAPPRPRRKSLRPEPRPDSGLSPAPSWFPVVQRDLRLDKGQENSATVGLSDSGTRVANREHPRAARRGPCDRHLHLTGGSKLHRITFQINHSLSQAAAITTRQPADYPAFEGSSGIGKRRAANALRRARAASSRPAGHEKAAALLRRLESAGLRFCLLLKVTGDQLCHL